MRKLNVLPDNPDEKESGNAVGPGRFPKWLHRKLPNGNALWKTQDVLAESRLPTVCEEAKCPNLLECWSKKTATFLAMGKTCTRSCGFCDIDFSKQPKPLEADEPQRLADSVAKLGLKHVVITMVARDDIPDGGADHLAKIIRAVRAQNRDVTIEVLTSDFHGSLEALHTVLDEKPEIFNHNIETVRALTPRVRHRATYERTLSLLRAVREYAEDCYVKSGLMVGLGESDEQVQETIRDLKEVGCQIITIGHYLQANRHKLRVKNFVSPAQFDAYAQYGKSIGIEHIYAGPFVRSSYNASSLFNEVVTHERSR
ncbi:MAG: Lipoyl synthase [Chlamydiales bacterium]|nr:Lipoyl synthase [Chlamydiales bacterium]